MSVAGLGLLNQLLTYDPAKRASARAALRHAYFREQPLPREPGDMPTFPSVHDAADAHPGWRSRRCVPARMLVVSVTAVGWEVCSTQAGIVLRLQAQLAGEHP